MRLMEIGHQAKKENDEITVEVHQDGDEVTYEPLPKELKVREKEEQFQWITRIAEWVKKENDKVKSIRKRIVHNGESFILPIKYLVEDENR